jgi:hypothetical protein
MVIERWGGNRCFSGAWGNGGDSKMLVIRDTPILGAEVFSPSELEQFIVWERRVLNSQERRILAELVHVIADITVNDQKYEANKDRVHRQYIAIMTYPLIII